MTTGTIKFFSASKGFGFVTPDGGGADIFLPAATVTASGLAGINPGQRVTFEHAPDKKGPKVVSLKLLGETVVKASAPAAERVKVYCDPSADAVADVLRVIHAAGYQSQLVDYITTPLSQEQLRALSLLLTGSGKSLVRRHDPLFSALQLDDRFIGDQDFWTAIAEHPALINGPVLVFSGKACVCRSPQDAELFLGKGGNAVAPKPKTLSPRVAALIRGESLAALPKAEAITPEPRKPSPTAQPEPDVEVKPKSKPKAAAKPRAAKAVKKIPATKKPAKPVKKPKK